MRILSNFQLTIAMHARALRGLPYRGQNPTTTIEKLRCCGLAGHVLEGIDDLSLLTKLRNGQVIRCHQDHMRARLCSSEPMSPTPVNNPGPEQIE